jgi:hypothetical protein
VADYLLTPPDGMWSEADNGTYQIILEANQVTNGQKAAAPTSPLGGFTVAVPPQIVTALGSISGVVISSGTGTGVQGATLFLDVNSNGQLDSGEVTAVTDAGGNYSFANLAAGTYQVAQVLPGGYSSQATMGSVNVTVASTNVTGPTFSDTPVVTTPNQGPAAFTGSIVGMVFNGQTDAPVANAEVFLDSNQNGVLDSGETSTITNSAGQYEFDGLAPDTYHVRQSASDSVTATVFQGTSDVAVANAQVAGPVFADTPAPATDSAPNLTGSISGKLTSNVVEGVKHAATLRINNIGVNKVKGKILVTLFASTTSLLEPGATSLVQVPVTINLPKGKSHSAKVQFTVPVTLALGRYYILASIDTANAVSESNELDNVTLALGPVNVTQAVPKHKKLFIFAPVTSVR